MEEELSGLEYIACWAILLGSIFLILFLFYVCGYKDGVAGVWHKPVRTINYDNQEE